MHRVRPAGDWSGLREILQGPRENLGLALWSTQSSIGLCPTDEPVLGHAPPDESHVGKPTNMRPPQT